MKKRNYMTAGRWMAVAAAALALGACSQSEETVEMLPEGKYPIELTATGLEPTVTPMTRATVDGNWEGVTKVAVEVDGVVKAYDVDASGAADNTTAVLKSATDPFYWKSTAAIKVSAWWPYSATKPATVTLTADQSDEAKYQESDQIEAVDQNVTYTAPTLKFTHRTAKVCVNVVNASHAAMAVDGVEVSLGSNTVKPYNKAVGTYLCLIPGGTATEANKLSVKITIDGATYVYTHPSAYTFDANKQYTFTLTVKRDGIQLNGCTISAWETVEEVKGEAKQPAYEVDAAKVWHIYNAEGLKAWGDAVKESSDGNVSAILENDIEMPAVADGESNWEPVYNRNGFCGTFDGNYKTITGLVVSTESHAGFIDNTGGYGGVKNLTLKDAKIKGTMDVGAVVARHKSSGKVENCRVTGASVIDAGYGNYAGGVVGSLDNSSTILACSVAKECEVKGTENQYLDVGGIVGYNKGGSVVLCYALCKLNGYKVGGICGKSISSGPDGTASFSLCYSKCQYSIIGSGSGSGIVREKSGDQNLSNCCYSGANTAVGDAADGTAVTKVTDEQQWHSEAVSSILDGKESDGYKYQKTDNTAEPYVIVKQQ